MRKKFLVLSMITMVATGVFSGCGLSGNSEVGSSKVEPVKVEAAENPTEEKKEEPKKESPEVGSLDFYRNLSDEIGAIEIIDSADLSLEDLENREGKIIIEKCIGVVENSDGDGKVLNCYDPDYDYISYRSVEDFQVGDTILTYLIYNPDTTYTDDILERFDYVIDREGK